MKSAIQSCLLLIVLVNSSLGFGAIYGADDRKDINQTPALRPYAQSVGASIPKNFLKQNADKTYTIEDVELAAGSSTANLCAEERFGKQPTVSNCTGFLVGDRYLVTAGHCVLPNGIIDNDSENPFCQSFSWYMDFNLKSDGKAVTDNIPENRIYHCKRMIRAENFEIPGATPTQKFGNDFAILELDRPVSADLKPLVTSTTPSAVGQSVYTIGHPTGLPAKFSGYSTIRSLVTPRYFEVALDTQGGNSGGPVFNLKNQVVGILVSGHPVDYYEPPGRTCYKANYCDSTGKKCNLNSEFKDLQTTNYVQYIKEALKYLPK